MVLRGITIFLCLFFIGFNFALFNYYKRIEGVYSFFGRNGIVFSIFIVQWMRLFEYQSRVSSFIFLSIALPSLILSAYGFVNFYKKDYHKRHD